jgi:hypothetical protein
MGRVALSIHVGIKTVRELDDHARSFSGELACLTHCLAGAKQNGVGGDWYRQLAYPPGSHWPARRSMEPAMCWPPARSRVFTAPPLNDVDRLLAAVDREGRRSTVECFRESVIGHYRAPSSAHWRFRRRWEAARWARYAGPVLRERLSYGPEQWISAAVASYATMALSAAVDVPEAAAQYRSDRGVGEADRSPASLRIITACESGCCLRSTGSVRSHTYQS